MSALPIFPGRFQPSIFGANELNYRVRDGNGWTLKEKRLCVSLKREKEYSIPLQKLQAFFSNFFIFSNHKHAKPFQTIKARFELPT